MKLLGRGCWRRHLPAKLLLVMRITSAILLISALHVSATGIGQTVSYSGKNVPLEQVFTAIKQQTGYVFFYKLPDLEGAKPVTVDFKNVPLEAALQKILQNQSLSFSIQGNTIFITLKTPTTVLQSVDSLPPHPVKSVRVQGSVYNEAGQPLSGATVTIVELKKATMTNADGQFDLGDIPVNSTIVISYMGYEPTSITVKEVLNTRVDLKPAINELNKVVIEGYGQTSARLQTGDISTVRAEEIERQPTVINPLFALEGKVTGLDIVQQNGRPSSIPLVDLRGRSSLGAFPADPLYIVDGVPLTVNEVGGQSSYATGSTGFLQNGYLVGPGAGQSPLFSINSDDIESITVLKDADATSIYGSRGANGVILITTKKGKAGKTKLDVKVEEGADKVTRFWSMLNTPQYLAVRREALYNDGIAATAGNAYDLLTWDTTRYTDWQRALMGRAGQVLNAQAAITGGDPHTTFRISAGYKRYQEPTAVSGANQNGNLSLNLEHKSLNDRLSLSSTTQYQVSQINEINLPGRVNMAPNSPPIYDSVGNLNYEGWAPVGTQYPFASLKQPYSSTTNFINSNLVVAFVVTKGLVVKSSFGYNYATADQTQFSPIASLNPTRNPTGTANWGNNTNKNWIVEPQVAYDGFISTGKLSAIVGSSLQQNTTDGQYINGSGYTNDVLLGTISNAPTKFASDNYGQYKYAAIFGRVYYNWDDEFLLNLSGRRDGSSNFGPNHEYGNFAAVGAAWIFTQERWFKKHLNALTFGKLRTSYGTTGSDAATPYSYLSRWSSSGLVPYGSVQPLVPTQHANPDYEWEIDKKLEAALELGFLPDNRIGATISLYRFRCGNQLVQYPTPAFTGFTSVQANSPAMVQNEGIEMRMTGKVIDTKSVAWSVNFNISANDNKLIAYPGLALSPYANFYQIGKPLNLVYLLHATGVDPLTGQYTFQDRNHDGVISVNPGPTDDRFIHNLNPRFFGGFGTDFTWNRLQVTVFFNYKSQIGKNAINQGSEPGLIYNQPTAILGKEWKKPGDIAQTARFTTQPNQSDANFQSSSDGAYTDASFIRCRNVSISYALSRSYIRKVGMQDCSVFLRGENLFVITKYKGIDPESQNFGGLPPAKGATLGLKFTF
jgi:TonB-linked SusC/RagA family outer membrane protein